MIMKKFLIGLMLAAMPVLAWSSTVENGYHSMFSEGKVWNYTYHAQGGDQKMSIEVKGDTVINNQSCYKLYLCTPVSRQIYGYYYEANYGGVIAYLMQDWRKEGGKWIVEQKNSVKGTTGLYHFMPSDFIWNYTYDANAIVDYMCLLATKRAPAYKDKLGYPVEYPYPVAVDRYELVQVGDAVFARAFLTDVQKHDTLETWVSGVGDRYWGIMNPVPAERLSGDEWIEFESCYEHGQCLFTKKDFDKEALSAPYRPFVENGKKWTCKTNPYGADIYYYYLQGDTIVDNKPCLKLFSQNRYNNGATCYEGALFEKDRQVFLYRGGSSTPSLLYDFSLEQGQIAIMLQSKTSSWLDYEGVERITDAIEMIDGQMFHIMIFYELFNDKNNELTYSYYLGAWIEGVGPTNKMDVIDNYGFGVMGDGYGSGIIDCSVNGKSFYRANNYEELMATQLTPLHNSKNNVPVIYDLQGRRLTGKPIKGVYIEDGKKRVVK